MRAAGLLGLAIVGFLGGGALAEDVRSFDILGMRLRMTVGEIEAAAASHGLLQTARMKAPSFDQAVMIRRKQPVKAQNFGGIRKLEFETRTRHIKIDFVATTDGSRAYMIHYVLSDPDVSSEQMSAEVEGSYGVPDKRGELQWIWGDTAAFPLRTKPNLEYRIDPLTSLVGRKAVGSLTLRDPQLPRESQAAIEAAAS